MLISETSTTGKKEYSYDQYLRLNEVTEAVLTDGKSFTFGYQYDLYGRLAKEIYPHITGETENSTLNYIYDAYGYPVKKYLGTTLIWEAKQYAEQGQLSKYILGNNITVTKEFDNQGRLTNITGLKGSNIYQNMSYGYRGDGNMHYRTDATSGVNKKEWFKYDTQNRLIGWETTGLNAAEPEYQTRISYSGSRISQKENIGNYGYSGFPHHGVKSSGVTTATNNPLDISYDHNMIDGRARVSSIISGNNSVTYTHGTSDELIKKTETKNGNTYTTYYAGGGKYELRIDNNNAETKMLYLGSGVVKYDAPGITDDKILYLLKDHLGSVVKVLSVSGSNVETLESFSYDVWGNRRNATTWANTNITTPTYIFKGFTGHEHIEGFGLIHMKGRVYDPVLGLFLSPDPYVQSSTTMGFNRYSYCMGNPLMYTDPDGKFFGPIIWAGSFLSDIIHYKTSFREAVYNANQIVGELGSAFQYTIFESNNHKVTAGLDIFGLGVSASYSYMWETGSATATAGIGIFGSYYANTNVKQNFITRRGNVFSLNGGVGYGNNNWGWNANAAFNGYGIGYGQTYYGNDIGPDEKRNNQTVGSFTIMGPKGSFNIQNDFLAFGFGRKDRWRSNAVEITIGNFSIGTWLYNNDPSGEGQIRDLDAVNRMGRKNRPIKNANEKDQVGGWPEGKVYASPLYIGLRTGNSISRFGYSSPWVQEFTQNVVHRWFPFGRQNYYTDDSQFIEGVYLYSGHYNPYSIWHPDFNISNNW